VAIRLKRAYERAAREDGYRVLVDRLWPRGVTKRALALDEWLRDIAPSDALRQWFHRGPRRFREFAARYRRELRREPAAGLLADLARRARRQRVTLVYSARDEKQNQAVVLKRAIERTSPRREKARPRGAPGRARVRE